MESVRDQKKNREQPCLPLGAEYQSRGVTTLFNTSLTMEICLIVPKIIANKTFIVTDGLISQLFVIAFVHSIYM